MSILLRILACTCLLLVPSAHADEGLLVLMPGQVIQGHAKVEEHCDKCHKKFDKRAQAGLCADCHKDVARDIAEKRGYHGRQQVSSECKTCHTDHEGRNAKIAQFDHAKFDHELTDYPLRGAHRNRKVTCDDCHKTGKKFREAPTYCDDCHKKDDKHKGSLGTNCSKCHVEEGWKKVSFDHDKTRFPLLGKHARVGCAKCHAGTRFKDTPMTCFACHRKDDRHKGQAGTKCEACHTEKGWKLILFDHDKETSYLLLGKHRDVQCAACHQNDRFKHTPTNCYACHGKDDMKAHKDKFGRKCETCHTSRDWKQDIIFDHDRMTRYPLLGKHRSVKCVACHTGDLYRVKLQTNCFACHRKDDKHKGNFGNKCETCHTSRDWKQDIIFDHDRMTKYPLLGKHRSVKCVACHTGDLYRVKLQTNCFACHRKDDKHKGQEGEKCASCHDARDWNKTAFNHELMSSFPLLGDHLLVACRKCHATDTFKDAKSDCWSCHQKDDVHKRKLGTTCQTCHNSRDWKAWDFDHDKTRFKLDGPHKKVAGNCYACHQQPMDARVVLATDCNSCHFQDDVHDGRYGSHCDQCHVGNVWKVVRTGVTSILR